MLNYNYGPDCNYSDSSTQISFIAKTGERLTTPKMVYDYLSKRIYKQEAAIKAGSLFLFKHVNRFGNTRVSLFCGSTGSGKTYLWDVIKQNLFPHIICFVCTIKEKNTTTSKTGLTKLYRYILAIRISITSKALTTNTIISNARLEYFSEKKAGDVI